MKLAEWLQNLTPDELVEWDAMTGAGISEDRARQLLHCARDPALWKAVADARMGDGSGFGWIRVRANSVAYSCERVDPDEVLVVPQGIRDAYRDGATAADLIPLFLGVIQALNPDVSVPAGEVWDAAGLIHHAMQMPAEAGDSP